jgi:DNA-directed RNA polymerase subunit RPC12/RpoP
MTKFTCDRCGKTLEFDKMSNSVGNRCRECVILGIQVDWSEEDE